MYSREGNDDDYENKRLMAEIPEAQNKISQICIGIEGMSCQSCVKNIESKIGSREGVVDIKVDLTNKVGHVKYKSDETTPEELKEAIQDMGFNTHLIKPSSNSQKKTSSKDLSLIPVSSTCSVHIDGMTCMSCVKNITGKMNIEN